MALNDAHLLERALDFTGAHTAPLDGSVKISTRTVFHDFTPLLVFILNEVDGFDDIGVVERGADAELGSQLFDVLLLRLVLAALAEFLVDGSKWEGGNAHIWSQIGKVRQTIAGWHKVRGTLRSELTLSAGVDGKETYLDSVEFLFLSIPLVSETDNAGGAFANRRLVAETILLGQAGGAFSSDAGRTAALGSSSSCLTASGALGTASVSTVDEDLFTTRRGIRSAARCRALAREFRAISE